MSQEHNGSCRTTTDPPGRSGAHDTLRGLRIMIVDDVQDTRDMVAEILSLRGAEVIAVASAREALDGIRRHLPDALITDISMPGEDGYTLIRAVRELRIEEGGRIPAMALTAHAGESARLRLLSAGFQMHLAKPVDLMELPSRLLELISNTPIRR